MFPPLQGHLQGVYLLHSGSVGQQYVSSDVQFNLVSGVYVPDVWYCNTYHMYSTVLRTSCMVLCYVPDV
jgi:hypothetical protein